MSLNYPTFIVPHLQLISQKEQFPYYLQLVAILFAFGSEDGSIQPFMNTFQLINNHRTEYNTLIKESLKTGASYPKSLHYAYEQLSQKFPATYIDLGQPNNILGFHYIEAATTLGSNIKPLTIPRIVAGYHDALQEGASIASATGIRKALATTNTLQSVEDFLPKASFDYLADWYENMVNLQVGKLFGHCYSSHLFVTHLMNLRAMQK